MKIPEIAKAHSEWLHNSIFWGNLKYLEHVLEIKDHSDIINRKVKLLEYDKQGNPIYEK